MSFLEKKHNMLQHQIKINFVLPLRMSNKVLNMFKTIMNESAKFLGCKEFST